MKVLGLDLAAANSGLCVMEVEYPDYSYTVIHEEALHHPMADFRNRVDAADYIGFLAEQHEVDIAAIEDYALRIGPNNTSAYQHGEVGGMVRKVLFERAVPFYVIPPTSMRSFMEVPPRSPKDYLETRALERLGFESKASTKKKRSDITDAVIHAHIGSLIHILRSGELNYTLSSAEERIMFGDNKIEGLKDRDGIYYEPTEEK